LRKKIHRQPGPSVRGPPTRSPRVPPAPAMAFQIPMARLRRLPSAKVATTRDRDAGTTTAALMPWATRAPMSHPAVLAKPQAAEGRHERCDAADEDPAAAVEIGKSTADEHQGAVADRVAHDDPLGARHVEPQVTSDAR